MCYPLPGPRCSPHAKARLEKLKERYDINHQNMVGIARERNAVRVALNADPESKKLKRSFASLTKRGALCKAKENELQEKVRLAQIEYDGTSKGQDELQEKLARLRQMGAPASKQMVISRRISKGRAKNFTRKFQYELAQIRKNTGKTTRERRGDFIGLTDRDSTTEIVEDRDILTAA